MARSLQLGRVFASVLTGLLFFCVTIPYAARAQQDTGGLNATIKGALLSDPRTSGLSEEEIDAIVNVLSQEAQKEGMTASDITWRPQSTGESFADDSSGEEAADICGRSLLCKFNHAFGFVGNDLTIPFILGIASMGLVWVIAEMLHRRRKGQISSK